MKKISHTDKVAEYAAREKWNSVAKPLGSLGLLENAVEKIAAVQGTANVDINSRAVVVMCADNGVISEGVSQSDSSMTAICANAIANGMSNINVLSDAFGARVIAVDMGIKETSVNPRLVDKRIAGGTRNIADGAAMTPEQAEKAICAGMDIVGELKKENIKIIVTGEMGIGNTTVASALASILLSLPPRRVTGRGAGLDSAAFERKISVIERAVRVNNPDKSRPIELLSRLGGFDIAGIVGLFLGGAFYRVPVVIDGVISAVAAVIAGRINPISVEYMLPSHVSAEPAGKLLLESLALKPLITAGMRLGEGTGGVMLLPLLDGALSIYSSAHRFDDISIERYKNLK